MHDASIWVQHDMTMNYTTGIDLAIINEENPEEISTRNSRDATLTFGRMIVFDIRILFAYILRVFSVLSMLSHDCNVQLLTRTAYFHPLP